MMNLKQVAIRRSLKILNAEKTLMQAYPIPATKLERYSRKMNKINNTIDVLEDELYEPLVDKKIGKKIYLLENLFNHPTRTHHRILNRLLLNGITTVEQLRKTDINHIGWLGKKSIAEIEYQLSLEGVPLPEEQEAKQIIEDSYKALQKLFRENREQSRTRVIKPSPKVVVQLILSTLKTIIEKKKFLNLDTLKDERLLKNICAKLPMVN